MRSTCFVVGMCCAGLLAIESLGTGGSAPSVSLAQSHPHGELSMDCGACHTPETWKVSGRPPGFDHGKTAFPLFGEHASVDCRGCHASLVFADAPLACVDCHEDIHQGDLGPQCETCHSTAAWTAMEPASVLHEAAGFPLLGAHAMTDCAACHADALAGGFAETPDDCAGCHLADYVATADPNHAAAGFSEDCLQCHSGVAGDWLPAQFDHLVFPLTEGHSGLACADCHTDGYEGTSAECLACHLEDYQTAEPSHAGFPEDCVSCHGLVAWSPASFDHDPLFPIFSGRHREEWNECSDCHTVPSDFSRFTCLDCHEHRQEETDREHREVQDYVYDSEACLSCHPDGSE